MPKRGYLRDYFSRLRSWFADPLNRILHYQKQHNNKKSKCKEITSVSDSDLRSSLPHISFFLSLHFASSSIPSFARKFAKKKNWLSSMTDTFVNATCWHGAFYSRSLLRTNHKSLWWTFPLIQSQTKQKINTVLSAVATALAADSLRTFYACKVSSTSGSNYCARESRFLAASDVSVQSLIARYFSAALKESTFSGVRWRAPRSNYIYHGEMRPASEFD